MSSLEAQPGMVPPGDMGQCLQAFGALQLWGASSGLRPEMLYILPCPGRPPPQKIIRAPMSIGTKLKHFEIMY